MKSSCKLEFEDVKEQRTFVCTNHKGNHYFQKKVEKGKLVCSPCEGKGVKHKVVKTPECPKCGSKRYVEVK